MKMLNSMRLVAGFLVFFAALTLNAHAQSRQPAQKIFDSMIQALGGQAYLDVKEIQVTGRYFTFRREEVSGSEPYVDYIKFPDMERTEFGKEKEKRIQINHGKEGWQLTPPAKGKDPDVKEQSIVEAQVFLENFKTSFDYVPRFVVNTPKTTLVNAGTDLIDFKRVDILEIRDPQKNLMRIFVDRETHLPLKVQRRDVKESTVLEDFYANWHKFDGVMTALTTTSYKDGVKIQEVHADSVTYNPGLSDSLFAAPPEKTSK